jgi:hypothetical protein
MDISTITAAIGAASAAVGLVDKIADQVKRFLCDQPETGVPDVHRQHIEGSGSEIVAQSPVQGTQTITADDFKKLPPDQLKHISVLEKSMQNYYDLWAAVYPQRNASADPIVNAKVNQQLKQIVSDMSDDFNGILSFLESCGLRLDDHYMAIRQLVSQAKQS